VAMKTIPQAAVPGRRLERGESCPIISAPRRGGYYAGGRESVAWITPESTLFRSGTA